MKNTKSVLDPKISELIISRTDSLGDVMVTLPLAGYLKSSYPKLKITFISAKYAQEIVRQSKFIDKSLIVEELPNSDFNKETAILFCFPDKTVAKWAKKNGIKYRVGSSHRLVHWLYANKRVAFSRRKSKLHEGQLNFKLLEALGIEFIPPFGDLQNWIGFPESSKNSKPRLILHPKSKGSARNWPLKSFFKLVELLEEQRVEVYISGTKEEGKLIRKECPELLSHPFTEDITGKYSLSEFLDFISKSEAIVAASTGPLHIGAAYGLISIGIYPNLPPMDPGRWGPIGKKAYYLTTESECKACPKPENCSCMNLITPEMVFSKLKSAGLFERTNTAY